MDREALQGERVRLRRLIETDLPAVQRWRSDPEVTRFWVTRQVPTLDDLKHWLAENRRSGSLTLLIEDEAGQPIGYSDVFGISAEHRHCELSLMIGEPGTRGRGYGYESLRVLLAYLFAPRDERIPPMHKVTLSVFEENSAARRLYERCGFRVDGVLREDMWYDGQWHDQLLMSVLAEEFRSQRSAD
jgi:RimJ/RimL family protein N-acetyltransferase